MFGEAATATPDVECVVLVGTGRFVEPFPFALLEPPLGLLPPKEGKWDRLGIDEGGLDKEE